MTSTRDANRRNLTANASHTHSVPAVSAGCTLHKVVSIVHNCFAQNYADDSIQQTVCPSQHYQSKRRYLLVFHVCRNVPPVGQIYCKQICEIWTLPRPSIIFLYRLQDHVSSSCIACKTMCHLPVLLARPPVIFLYSLQDHVSSSCIACKTICHLPV